jgi:polysaccharide pyruvyl transferase WcaK-like protein
MLIEIRRAGFVNKGAELMLYAALQKMKENYPEAIFAMTPDVKTAPYEKRAKLGFLQKASLWRYGFQWGKLAKITPKKIRKMYGVVLDKEVNVVLDVAGFAYSDQLGKRSCLELADSCKRWKKNGTKIILLPQAFGPFSSRKNKKAIKTIIANADLVFARDPVSYRYLTDVVGDRENIKIAPDFTNLVDGIVPDDFDVTNNRFCIIPNFQMIAKTTKQESDSYLPFMIKCTNYLITKGKKPFVLVHESAKDLELAEKLRDGVNGNLPIIIESDPLKIKGIIGVCEGTIGSRFHGLVSALSQGVPSLAVGWSHKYEMLFKDYGLVEGVIDMMTNIENINHNLDMITTTASINIIRKNIFTHSNRLKILSNKMWVDVLSTINNT